MEVLLPLLAAVLVAVGVFLVLSRALIRVIVGISVIGSGANLSILLAGGGSTEGSPPLLNLSGPHVDGLPQALILTAIVIGFGTTALVLVLAVRAYQVTRTDHVQELTERADPVVPPRIYADPEHPSVSPERGPQPLIGERGPAAEGEAVQESSAEDEAGGPRGGGDGA